MKIKITKSETVETFLPFFAETYETFSMFLDEIYESAEVDDCEIFRRIEKRATKIIVDCFNEGIKSRFGISPCRFVAFIPENGNFYTPAALKISITAEDFEKLSEATGLNLSGLDPDSAFAVLKEAWKQCCFSYPEECLFWNIEAKESNFGTFSDIAYEENRATLRKTCNC